MQDFTKAPLKNFEDFIDRVNDALSKAKALALVAVTTDFAEYQPLIIHDYLDALLSFIEELEEVFVEASKRFMSVEKINSCYASMIHHTATALI